MNYTGSVGACKPVLKDLPGVGDLAGLAQRARPVLKDLPGVGDLAGLARRARLKIERPARSRRPGRSGPARAAKNGRPGRSGPGHYGSQTPGRSLAPSFVRRVCCEPSAFIT